MEFHAPFETNTKFPVGINEWQWVGLALGTGSRFLFLFSLNETICS